MSVCDSCGGPAIGECVVVDTWDGFRCVQRGCADHVCRCGDGEWTTYPAPTSPAADKETT